jgi:hypothetical protein
MLLPAGVVRICEDDNPAPLGADSLDEASKMSQRSLDTCGVSVTDLVQRLNEAVGIVAQLRHHGIRLIDKLDDCAASISASTPDRCTGEVGEPLNASRVAWRGEIRRRWLGLAGRHSPREFLHVHDLASVPAPVLHYTLPCCLGQPCAQHRDLVALSLMTERPGFEKKTLDTGSNCTEDLRRYA